MCCLPPLVWCSVAATSAATASTTSTAATTTTSASSASATTAAAAAACFHFGVDDGEGFGVEGAGGDGEELLLFADEVNGVAAIEGAGDLVDLREGVAIGGGVRGNEGAEGEVEVALIGVLGPERGEGGRCFGEVRDAREEGFFFVLFVANDRAIEIRDRVAHGRERSGIVVIGEERGGRRGEGEELPPEAIVAVAEAGEDVGMGKLVVHGVALVRDAVGVRV